MKGSDDPLFKKFKRFFGLDKRTFWKWLNTLSAWRHCRANEFLLWADSHMQKMTWSREDCRELLELVVIYLRCCEAGTWWSGNSCTCSNQETWCHSQSLLHGFLSPSAQDVFIRIRLSLTTTAFTMP